MFKCLFYVVNIIIKVVLSSYTHIITIMQDGGQDGCNNHTIIGILLLKRHSNVSYIISVVCLKCPFLVVHIIVMSFGFS